MPTRGIDALQDVTEDIYEIQSDELVEAREAVVGYMDTVRVSTIDPSDTRAMPMVNISLYKVPTVRQTGTECSSPSSSGSVFGSACRGCILLLRTPGHFDVGFRWQGWCINRLSRQSVTSREEQYRNYLLA